MTDKAKNYILLVIATVIGVVTNYFVYTATKSFIAYLFVGIGLPLIVFLVASFFTKSDEENNATENSDENSDENSTDAE